MTKSKKEAGSVVDWNAVPDAQRREALNGIFIPRSSTTDLVDAMQELRKRGLRAALPVQP